MASILIVDDDPHTIRVMAIWLARRGHKIVEAKNGREAVTVLRSPAGEDIDLIISDMNMPVMDGLELVEIVRREMSLEVPVIIFSSRCDQSSLRDRLDPFEVHLYPKPFIPSRLVQKIDQVLSPQTST